LACATPAQRRAIERKRKQIWKLYRALKRYAAAGLVDSAESHRLRARFNRIFNTGMTGFAALDELLGRLFAAKNTLLRVLDRPDVPLHTNNSESDIRIRVPKRKISGGTRGDEGLRCLDTFVSIVKTLRKHGLTFWDYLGHRLTIAGPQHRATRRLHPTSRHRARIAAPRLKSNTSDRRRGPRNPHARSPLSPRLAS